MKRITKTMMKSSDERVERGPKHDGEQAHNADRCCSCLAWTRNGGDGPRGATPPAAPSAPPAASREATSADEAVVLNFEGADIREVIHSLATALGISYTIDPRVQGQVTIRTSGRIAGRDLFPYLSSDSPRKWYRCRQSWQSLSNCTGR